MSDFQYFYGLRLSEVIEAYPAEEVLHLIQGLPETSLFRGRQMGEENARGFGDTQALLYTIYNKIEQLRLGYFKGNFKGNHSFDEYENVPGAKVAKQRRTRRKAQGLWDRLAHSGGKIEYEQ